MALSAVAEGSAQGGDVDRQIRLLDHGSGPHDAHEFALADQLARAFYKRDQDIQSPAAEAYRFIAFEEQPLSGEQSEGPK